MDMSAVSINWWSTLVATLVGFLVLGGIWYGPLFGRAWMTAFGFTEAQLAERNLAKVFGISALLAWVAAINLAMFIGPNPGWLFGAMAGFFAGLGWVATLLGILYLFEQRPLKGYLINAGYCVVSLTTMGTILGAWPA